MNFALSAFILFLFLLPGIAFRKLYYSGQFSHQYFRESFFSVFTATIVPALTFQTLGLWVIDRLSPGFDVTFLLDLLTSSPSDDSLAYFSAHIEPIVAYTIAMTVIGVLSGMLVHYVVRKYKWDLKFTILRYRNYWHYIIEGELFDFRHTQITLQSDSPQDIAFRYVDAIQHIGGETYIYDGLLVDYQLSTTGGLDTIILKEVKRRRLTDDAKTDDAGNRLPNSDAYYPVKGHLVILKYEELANINFAYYTVDHDQNGLQVRLIR